METYLAILNPAAQGGRCGRLAREALSRLQSLDFDVEIAETTEAGHATDIVRQAYQAGRRHFIAVGGDGTVFEIINGLFPLAWQDETNRPVLGFLPLGTGNSFLRDFTESGTEYAIEALQRRKSRPCDVLCLAHRDGVLYFINQLGMGFVADVAFARDRHFQGLGNSGYIFGVFLELTHLHETKIPMWVDDEPLDSDSITFLAVANSRYTGGNMLMAPAADPSDGYADLVCARKVTRWRLLKSFPRIFKGTHIELPTVTTSRFQKLDFDVEAPMNVVLDGEVRSLVPRHLTVLPGAIDARI